MRWLTKILKSNEHARGCYAINHGIYKGNFFVYMNHTDLEFNFLRLPDNLPVTVPADVFKQGQKNKIVDRIEKLPYNVYEICVAQYNEAKAKDNINRLKQPPSPSSVDNGEHEE